MDLTSIAIGDFNHDGKNDVAVGRYGNSIAILYQNISGTLDTPISIPTGNSMSIEAADFNHDGFTDIAGLGWGTNVVDVYLQDTVSGGFNSYSRYSAYHAGYDELESGDMNYDGNDDLIPMSGQLYAYPNFSVLLQDTIGTFSKATPYTIASNTLTSGIGIGDVNGDGRNDVVASYNAKVAVYLQTITGTLTLNNSYTTYGFAEPVEIADVNGDGRSDVVTIISGGALNILLQNSSGTLNAYETYSLPYATHYNPKGLAVGDINGDGTNDIALADYNHGLIVMLNQRAPASCSLWELE